MSPKEHGKVARASPGSGDRDMVQTLRVSSSFSNRPNSRQASVAEIMAQMTALDLASARSEMERLRRENEDLRGIIQQLGSYRVDNFLDEDDAESSEGALEDDAYSIPDPGVSIIPPHSISSNNSDATILKNPQPVIDNLLPTDLSEEGETVEGADHSQIYYEANDQLAQAILESSATAIAQEPSAAVSEIGSTSVDTDEAIKKLISQSSSIYDVPDDFDPDNGDNNLSDVETVTSDEVLQAWGIGEQPPDVREISDLQTRVEEIGEATDEDDDDEDDWQAVNTNHGFTPDVQPTITQNLIAPASPENPDINEKDKIDSDSANSDAEEEDDASTILGEPRSASAGSVSDDDKASTVAETGSDGSTDKRWLDLMRDLEKDIDVNDLEKARSEAEEEERDARDQEYRDAIAEKKIAPQKHIELGQASHTLQDLPAVVPEGILRKFGTETSLTENAVEQGLTPKPENEIIQVPKTLSTEKARINAVPMPTPMPRAVGPQDPWLLNKFNEIWSTLTPGLPAGSTGSVGWINSKPVTGNRNDPFTNLQHESPNQNTTGENNRSRMTESERILLSFDPREDVIGILRPKAKGEKNILGSSTEKIDPEQPKTVKASKQKGKTNNEEPIRPVGKIENQFRALKEERLQRQAAEKVQRADSTQQDKPAVLDTSLVEATAKARQVSALKKSPPRPTPPQTKIITNEPQLAPKPPGEVNLPPKSNQKLPTSLSVKTGDLLNNPELVAQPPVISKEPQESIGASENEVGQQKSLRFHGVSPPSKDKMHAKAKDPLPRVPKIEPLVNGPPQKPLVSILKHDTPITSFTSQLKPKPYNYEYIREVCIRNLPKDITYSNLLDQVSGGILEKVTIDMTMLEARITFVEPEAARRFYAKVEQNGFWVHTGLPDIRLVGKEGLVQCTLGGFLWTQNSSQPSPSMIEGIWNRRSSRCLFINDFPRGIMIEQLIRDIFKIFNGTLIKGSDTIETLGIRRNTQVSATGFIAWIRFNAIMHALKVGRELRQTLPEYAGVNIVYDADPCGGLMGSQPPSVWMQGKLLENSKPGSEHPVPHAPKLQTAIALPNPISRRSTGVHRGQSSPPKMGRGFGRGPVLRPQRPTRPIIPPFRNQTTDSNTMAKRYPVATKTMQNTVVQNTMAKTYPAVTQTMPNAVAQNTMTKTYSAAAQTMQNVVTQPIRPSTPRPQPQAIHSQPQVGRNLQEGLPPQNIVFRYNYNNWDAEPEQKSPSPEGAHWNHKEQNLVQEYQQALVKKRRRGSDADKASTVEKKKIERQKPEPSYYDRVVYLTNLPRDLNFSRLFRFIRGGPVEHLILQAPSSQYDTSKAIIIFIHRYSARDYKSYLQSPGLTIQRGHRIASMEIDANDRHLEGIRLIPTFTIRTEGITRCLKIDMLPNNTTIEEVIGIIEEGMNHTVLEFEYGSIDISQEDRDKAVMVLRLVTVGMAVWVNGMLRKHYDGIVISYDRDPCEGPLAELEEVDVKEVD